MKKVFSLFLLCIVCFGLSAQAIRDASVPANETTLPLNRVVIFTSGVAYHRHSGSIDGNVNINFPFRINDINDVLKSLIINDPSSVNPSVTYQSQNTLWQTLRSLSIDLSDNPDMATILSRLRGAQVEITAPALHRGRIIGIDHRVLSNNMIFTTEPFLLLNTEQGMRHFNLREVTSIRFLDAVIEQDLNRALDLIAASRDHFSRNILLNLPGTNRRSVSVSYVVPFPVWKVSYRLDLGAQPPLFQGWAIVDNDSDNDWHNVELSLVAGRPVSFIQELYAPLYVFRPTLPLSIAGTADALVHDRGVVPLAAPAPPAATRMMLRSERAIAIEDSEEALSFGMPQAQDYMAVREAEAWNLAGGIVETAEGADAGGQFEFTIRHPVNLNRRMSAMLALVEAPIQAQRSLIFSGRGSRSTGSNSRHPRLGAEITNTTGMRLPAGPITVFDGGVYAGTALIEFWNENETRLISFGEDLSVTASTTDTITREFSSVNISRGVMTITRNMVFVKTYTFINSGSDARQLIIEHAKTANTDLVSPSANDQTSATYRFSVELAPNAQTVLTVKEQRPILETISLVPLHINSLISFSADSEIPVNVRTALQRAVELRRAVDSADAAVRDIEAQRNRVIADQDRTRRNLEAAGNQTQQGQEFLRRLVALDGEIDTLSANLETAISNARAARIAFENYLNTLNF